MTSAVNGTMSALTVAKDGLEGIKEQPTVEDVTAMIVSFKEELLVESNSAVEQDLKRMRSEAEFKFKLAKSYIEKIPIAKLPCCRNMFVADVIQLQLIEWMDDLSLQVPITIGMTSLFIHFLARVHDRPFCTNNQRTFKTFREKILKQLATISSLESDKKKWNGFIEALKVLQFFAEYSGFANRKIEQFISSPSTPSPTPSSTTIGTIAISKINLFTKSTITVIEDLLTKTTLLANALQALDENAKAGSKKSHDLSSGKLLKQLNRLQMEFRVRKNILLKQLECLQHYVINSSSTSPFMVRYAFDQLRTNIALLLIHIKLVSQSMQSALNLPILRCVIDDELALQIQKEEQCYFLDDDVEASELDLIAKSMPVSILSMAETLLEPKRLSELKKLEKKSRHNNCNPKLMLLSLKQKILAA